jgi:predicted permease
MAVAKKSAKAPVVQSRNDRIDWRSLITLLVILFSTVALINAIMNSIFPDPVYIDVYAKPENAPSAELLAQQERNNQIQAIKSIFTSFITIAVATPLYIYHWRQTKK